MGKTYNVEDIADYFIVKSNKKFTQIQLQKMVYFAHGFYLAGTKSPLISQAFQAWDYGPVCEDLYQNTKFFGKKPVKYIGLFPPIGERPSDSLDAGIKSFLDKIYKAYGHLSAAGMVHVTHQEGTPWAKVYKAGVDGEVIPNESISKHFKKILGR